MRIKCPICKNITTWDENIYRPFCSQRCKLIDLGKWLTEDYKISEPLTSKEEIQETLSKEDEGLDEKK